MTLKNQFLRAVIAGDLGTRDAQGITVTAREFKVYFSDITSDYIHSFLPASVIEPGRTAATHTRFLFRVARGLYRVHPDAIQQYLDEEENLSGPGRGGIEEVPAVYAHCA